MDTSSTRYALYFSPAPDSAWCLAGCHWLGRDPISNSEYPPPDNLDPGVPIRMQRLLTAEARRYGFHATLKAPFRLAAVFSELHLLEMANAFASVQKPVEVTQPQILALNDFLSIRSKQPQEDIASLAMRCVSYFDLLRAPPSIAELSKRRLTELSPRQATLLQRWGYPYTEEEFCFHMTLSDSLTHIGESAVFGLRKSAENCFAEAMRTPLNIDAISIFREEEAGRPLTLWKRIPFATKIHASSRSGLPPSGRLFFVVGPSGVGKDTLLHFAKNGMPCNAATVFAQRTITRENQALETHESCEADSFWQLAAEGYFSMIWQANDLCYGVRRGMEAHLKAGRDVVVNGSREYVPQLMQLFPDAKIVWIEADTKLVMDRLIKSKSNSGAALLRRQERIDQFMAPAQHEIIRIDNSGPPHIAGSRLCEILFAPRA